MAKLMHKIQTLKHNESLTQNEKLLKVKHQKSETKKPETATQIRKDILITFI